MATPVLRRRAYLRVLVAVTDVFRPDGHVNECDFNPARIVLTRAYRSKPIVFRNQIFTIGFCVRCNMVNFLTFSSYVLELKGMLDAFSGAEWREAT